MKALFKVMVIIAIVFASTFIILRLTGVLSIEHIESLFNRANAISPAYIIGITVLFLFCDLFIALPTLTITILAGFFLGHFYGTIAAISGMMLAGICGYFLCARFGDKLFTFVVKDGEQREQAKQMFKKHGFTMILLSRAVPILPETTACLAGMTGMSFKRFLCAWSISTIPYCVIAVYSGSISSIENPKPAILTAVILTASLWFGWYLFNHISGRKNSLLQK